MIYFACPTEITDFVIKIEYISQDKGPNAPFGKGEGVHLDLLRLF